MRRLLIGLVLFASLPALAQDDPAREAFIRGAQLYQSEDYEGALEAFRESYGHREVPVVLFNMAQCLRFLGRPGEAIDAFSRYLESEQQIDAARQTAVEDAMRELEAQLSPVRIVVNVPGAEVRVGERVLGTSPFEGPVYVDAGNPRFVATREGYVPAERSIRARAGTPASVRLELVPEPEEGTLRVDANIAGAVLFVDDRRIGELPIERSFSAGEHYVEVEADGYRDYGETITLADDETRELQIELEVRERIVDEWWFWGTVAGAALVGIVLALVLTVPADPQPLEGTLPTVRALEVGP